MMHPMTINTIPDTVDRWVSQSARFLLESRFVLHLAGKIRRMYLVHFRSAYVQRQLAARRGQCSQCGTCCNLLFTCPLLTSRGLCLIYGKCRPQVCKVFPIDQRDIDEVTSFGKQCGYWYDPA